MRSARWRAPPRPYALASSLISLKSIVAEISCRLKVLGFLSFQISQYINRKRDLSALGGAPRRLPIICHHSSTECVTSHRLGSSWCDEAPNSPCKSAPEEKVVRSFRLKLAERANIVPRPGPDRQAIWRPNSIVYYEPSEELSIFVAPQNNWGAEIENFENFS